LSNPYIEESDLIAFARVLLRSIHELLEPSFEQSYYVTSRAIANGTKDICPVKSMLPHQVQKILNSSKLAVMTSGLGNIFEASTMQRRVLWLPPANDSQGQQIKLLEQNRMADFAIDWHEILEDELPIDYFAPQEEVLKRIAVCMKKLATSKTAEERFKTRLRDILNRPETAPSLSKLADTFEVGGAKQAAESMLQYLQDSNP
jgi:hypothetical protein